MSYLVVLMAVLSFASSMFSQASSPLGTITSGSMMPILGVGDIVFIQPTRIEDVRVGDIVAYYATQKTVVIHRVEKILLLPEKVYLITKGDANDVTDQSVGFPPIKRENFLGKVLCIDGIPVKIPLIGSLWLQIYNFSIWLTQDKPWSFWAPILATIYICLPTLSQGKKIYQKHLARRTINKKQIFVVAFLVFSAISLFTLWFRVEQYSVGLRVACLMDFDKKHSFNYGSMIYGQEQDNKITVTGAPMFPVKAISVVKGNVSLLSSMIPESVIIEPKVYFDLKLHTEIPDRGKIEPGLYEGAVYVFSSSLWTLMPNEAIFKIFNSFDNVWISAILLELLGALLLTSLITALIFLSELTVKQMIYTYVWLRRGPEEGSPPSYLLRLKSIRQRVKLSITFFKNRIGTAVGMLSIEGRIRSIGIFTAIAIASSTFYFITDSFIFSAIIECSLSCLFAISKRLRQKNALVGIAFTHTVYCGILIIKNFISAIYSFHGVWSLSATGFAGSLFAILTTPIIFAVFLLSFRVFTSMNVLNLEQETMNWIIFRKVKFVWPNFGRTTAEIIPRKIEIWRYSLSRRIATLMKPRRLIAESCKVIKPLEFEQKTIGKLDVEKYVSNPGSFFAKIELRESIRKRIHVVEEFWMDNVSKSSVTRGGKM